jgi:hypothetical protein
MESCSEHGILSREQRITSVIFYNLQKIKLRLGAYLYHFEIDLEVGGHDVKRKDAKDSRLRHGHRLLATRPCEIQGQSW